MFALLVLTITLLGVVLSNPDAGSQYNYIPPSVPFRNDAQNLQSYQSSASYSQQQYQQPQAHNNINQYQQQPQNNFNHYQQNAQNYNSGSSSQQQNGFRTAGYADQAGFGPQSSDVYKSLYYFDSPEDIEIPAPRFRYENERKDSKHYKIIFIKAPAYVQKPITDIQANIGASGGGKTIIYVLTKKPEAQQDVIINTGAAQQAVSKPEVYYIKYSNKQDAEHQISQSLNGQQGAAIQGRPLGSDQEFISNIRDNIDVRSQGPIIKNLGSSSGGHDAPQGAQILGFNQQNAGGFSTNAPHGVFSSSTGFSTLAPSSYSGGSTGYSSGPTGYSTEAPYGGSSSSFTTDSYGNQRH